MTDFKQLGNEAFKAGKFDEAVKHFTEAIKLNPSDGILYSNRSGAYASMNMYQEALADAQQCVTLKPDWPKGYSRKGLALYKLGKMEEAKKAYQEGLKIDPNNEPLKAGLREVDVSSDPQFMYLAATISQLVATNPKLQEYQRQDPSYTMTLCRVLTEMQSNPQNIQHLLMDPNPALRDGIMAYLGMAADIGQAAGFNEPPQPPKAEPPKETKPEPKEEPLTESQKKAQEFKDEGNKLYKQKKFVEALELYDKAVELDPNNLLLENNKAAAYLEMGDYEKCINTCKAAIERRYDVKADFLVISKIYNRLASCYTKMEDYDAALAAYQKSLLEDNNRVTRCAMKEVERLKEKKEREAYIDPQKAEEHREKGNEFFKKFQFPEAKKEYDEAIKRNPKDAKLYTNRAAALTKLTEYPSALADCNKAIEIDPTFVKAWARKGNLHVLLKEYSKALEAYDKGLAVDPNNQDCINGKYDCMAKIQAMSQSGTVDEEQYRQAMADPEVQQILGDPQFQIILKKLQENPASMNEYLRDPKVAKGIQKLMACGILRTA
ncbi:tetratricopeptide repeat domain containing protein, putative [Babesia bigemina]|uniref:Hsp70-Hsp90 organising protein n=1 Tax=Babesia bigemina TaxID=5866 RepID=A0A061D906_BABBI|nr:tetratricopeptide repeat domain containing protein, putative [Babesia bigemina]CDR96457.1 tetratricopeptide repeat domain containing protein, putative [Babesia bigemina]|eukprot:XP_012768643.1 tetratricopeptide repeat domain containing protein, putative [Babesia bigemina]